MRISARINTPLRLETDLLLASAPRETESGEADTEKRERDVSGPRDRDAVKVDRDG